MSCKCSDIRGICLNNDVVDIIGLCDPTTIDFGDTTDPNNLSFTEISIPEVMMVPFEKPDIESIDKVFVKVIIKSKRVVETPVGTLNAEGTILTGWKLIIEGILCQKIVYTADLPQQSVHSFHFNIPFSAFIVLPDTGVTLESEFCIETCIEDVFVKAFNGREVFKNVTLFLRALPKETVTGCL